MWIQMDLESISTCLFSGRDCKLFIPEIDVFEASLSQPISILVFSIRLSIVVGIDKDEILFHSRFW